MEREAYTLEELLAVELSRHIRPGDRCGFIGTGTGGKAYIRAVGLPAVAARLAQLRHAPGFALCLGSVVDMDLDGDSVPDTNFEPDMLAWPGRSQLPSQDVLDFFRSGRVDVGFISAPQVDRHGNTNLVRIGGGERPGVRFPGCLAHTEIVGMARRVLGVFHHDAKTFVERVDFVTGAGHDRRDGLPGGGLQILLTQYAVLDFDGRGGMKVRSIHPGCTARQIRENTGFAIHIPDGAPPTAPPTAEELELIRTRIDPRRKFLNAAITGQPARLLD